MTNNIAQAPAPQAPLPAPKSTAGKGLGIAALIIAIVALLLCWVPIINNFAAFLGLVSLVLGVVSLVLAAKRNGSKGLGIASTVISVVAIVLVFVTQAAYSKAIDDISAAVEDAADGERATPAELQEAISAANDGTAESGGDAAAEVLALGAGAEVGAYTVVVDAVKLDATKEVLAANTFNDEPAGQYALVDLSVAYAGAEEGTPWIDLGVELVGSDARIYDTSSCGAVVENPGTDLPDLTTGGTGSFQVCFDVPEAAVADAKIRVSERISFTDDAAAIWATK